VQQKPCFRISLTTFVLLHLLDCVPLLLPTLCILGKAWRRRLVWSFLGHLHEPSAASGLDTMFA
jgi:hypothetical protein